MAIVSKSNPSLGGIPRFVRLERLANEVLDFIRAVNDGDLVDHDIDILIATRRLERDLEQITSVLTAEIAG